jgi:hypothetical protein
MAVTDKQSAKLQVLHDPQYSIKDLVYKDQIFDFAFCIF